MITSKFLKNKSLRRGFTLVETLIAIGILLVAVVGPISLIGDALHKLYYAKDEMIAINLAQEGVEVARQKRDTNMLSGVLWNTGLAVNDYWVDATLAKITACGTNPCNAARKKVYVSSVGTYVQAGSVPAGSTATVFNRDVMITAGSLPSGDDLQVTSTVTWTTGGSTGTVSATEYLFHWAI